MSLPEDILTEILLRSPVKSVWRWRHVSKRWSSLIRTPYFFNRHLERTKHGNHRILFSKKSNPSTTITLHSLDYDATNTCVSYEFPLTWPLSIVGSCNGLVCLSNYQSLIVLCNPATCEYEYIPFGLLHKVPEDYSQKFALGFGHDAVADEYKVVRFDVAYSNTTEDRDDCKVYVYTLGGSKPVWRRIESPAGRVHTGENGIYFSGVLHWLKLSDRCRWSHQQTLASSILSFDVRKEKFRTSPMAPSTPKSHNMLGESIIYYSIIKLNANRLLLLAVDTWPVHNSTLKENTPFDIILWYPTSDPVLHSTYYLLDL